MDSKRKWKNATLGGFQKKKKELCIFGKVGKNRWTGDIFPKVNAGYEKKNLRD